MYLQIAGKAAEADAPVRSQGLAGDARVLVVDDEEKNTLTAKRMLEDLGYRVTVSSSSREALDIFDADPDGFDLVITDQSMPELSGQELAVRMLARRSDLPIVMITGFSAEMTAEKSRDIGIREFLHKPFTQDEIGGAVRRALEIFDADPERLPSDSAPGSALGFASQQEPYPPPRLFEA